MGFHALLHILQKLFRIPSDKSCDIRMIDDIIVRCQQGQMIQHQHSTSVKVFWLRLRTPNVRFENNA